MFTTHSVNCGTKLQKSFDAACFVAFRATLTQLELTFPHLPEETAAARGKARASGGTKVDQGVFHVAEVLQPDIAATARFLSGGKS